MQAGTRWYNGRFRLPALPPLQSRFRCRKDVYKRQALAGFIEMRKDIEKPLTDRALSMVLNKLDKLAGAHAG